ncbi:MAG TPA: TolC family protein [Bacteroidales bacterium]|nr:TolC family protein [Bacteroidales bacterium]
MNLLQKTTTTFLLIFALTYVASAQQIYNLDLESSIELAKVKSKTMLILQQSLQKASFDLKAATSGFKTHVDMDFVIPQYTETIRQWEDSSGISFYPVRQNQINSYLTINQPLPTDGYLFIRSGVQSFVDYYADDRNAQISSSIGLRQPIEAFFGYNQLRLGYKQAKLAYDLSLKQLKREELNLIYDISQTFFTLISYHERLNIAQLSMNKQNEAYNIARSKYNAGLIREVEALQMEVDLSEAVNNLDIANVEYSAQVELFKERLGIDLQDSVNIKSDLEYTQVQVDAEKAVTLALDNRLELKENEIQIELAKMEIKKRKADGMINGDIMVNYNFIGVDKSKLITPLETSLNNTWQNLINRPGSFGVGLTINIPIIDWGENRAKVHSAQATLAQNKFQQDADRITIERDIRTTVSRLQSSLKRLQLLEKNVVVAEKSFEISRQRYANGDIDSQSMALERERLNNAYISRLESFINYKLLLSDLMRKTFFDFEKNVSMLNN